MILLDKGKPNENEISNYRPFSVLNAFSTFYEKVIKKQLPGFMEEYFSPLISAYRTNDSSQHVIIRLLEERRKKLDDNFVVGAVLTDLSKVFGCIPHDLLIAKLAAYGLNLEALMYILSCLSNRKQCVRTNDTSSEFENMITGVSQGSILDPLSFSLSINDLFFLIASVHNFADDNTLSAFAENISKLINIFQSECEVITDWFKKNQTIVNPDKFQVVIIDKKKRDHANENIVIDNKQIKAVPSIELLEIQLDDKLNFIPHVSNICKSNALIRLQKFLNLEENKILINSYFIANFNYCPLVWMFSIAVSLKKIENFQKRALRFSYKSYNTNLVPSASFRYNGKAKKRSWNTSNT